MASQQRPDLGIEEFYRRAAEATGRATLSLRAWVDLAEAWRIAHALRESRGNRSAAARALGIGRRTLYSKMGKLGIGPTWSAWTSDVAPQLAAPEGSASGRLAGNGSDRR